MEASLLPLQPRIFRLAPHGLALHLASPQLCDDREVALAAVQQNGFALQHASPQLRGDRQIVLAAVQQNARAVQFGPPFLRKLMRMWHCARLLFVGHADEASPLSWLPAELVRGPLLAALIRVL